MQGFDPSTTDFRPGNAYHMAHFANLAYDIRADIDRYHFGDYEYRIKYINHFQTDVQALIADAPDHIVISIRGTEPTRLKDWMTDLDFKWFNTCWGYRFHRGFWWGYMAISPILLTHLCHIGTKAAPKPVWITGHSAGAGMGVILCNQMQRYHPIGGLYTFGAPRVGCQEFRRSFNDRFRLAYRIVYNNDIVTRIPPQIHGFSHAGELWYFDHDGNLHCGADLSWWARMWDRFEGRIEDIGDLGPDGIKDHSMLEYLRLCEQAAMNGDEPAPTWSTEEAVGRLHQYQPCKTCGQRGYHTPDCPHRWH